MYRNFDDKNKSRSKKIMEIDTKKELTGNRKKRTDSQYKRGTTPEQKKRPQTRQAPIRKIYKKL